jgi:alkylation response protein AidB-like acyl-CoA dehydrogenase
MNDAAATNRRLIEQAAALVPVLRERAPAAEQARRLPAETFDLLSNADVFRMTAAKRFGGYEADFLTQCEVLEQVARGCPSSSWIGTIFAAMSWLVSTFPDEAQDEVFDSQDPRISGVFSPTGTAVRKNGGYVVNGRWGYNTGGHGSNWTIVNTLLDDGGDAPLPMCALLHSRELQRLDDWFASGMTATGSSTIIATDVFVPAHRAQPLPGMLGGNYGDSRNAANPYYRYPLAAVLAVNAAGTPVGIARAALELFRANIHGRPMTYTSYADKAQAPVTHLHVGEAALTIDSADAHMRLACAPLDERIGQPLSIMDRVQMRAHVSAATGLARDATDLLFHASGAGAIQSHVPIQRFQRDMQALANHAIMHPQTTTELYGRVLCGLEPNTLIV